MQRHGSKLDMYVVQAPCKALPLKKNGWCESHQHCQELLDRGAQLGYPRVQLNVCLWVGAGLANWEAYAVRFPAKRRDQVMYMLEHCAKEGERDEVY
jgi:hypothetical protein